MSNDDILAQWWNALSAQEKEVAFEAERTGMMPTSMQSSLSSAGAFELPTLQSSVKGEKPVKVPRQLRDFLKMRH